MHPQVSHSEKVELCLIYFTLSSVSAECFARQSKIIKGMRKHAGWRFGTVHYRYSHIFICLREGKPPKHYHAVDPTGNEKMQVYLDDLRKRRIYRGL